MSLPKLYFSYQGAFGPPTYGHYKAMDAFTDNILKEYNGLYEIHMMFMPTAASSSKPHLEFSQDNRLELLNLFCDKLSNKYNNYKNLYFHASNLEFELRKSGNMNTSTIFTIEKISNELNYNQGDILILGMGKDNMLQLPYWLRVNEYIDYVKSIYIVDRKLTNEEMEQVDFFKVLGQENLQQFQKNLPWSIDSKIINERFNIHNDLYQDKYEKGTDVTKLQEDYKNQLNIYLPNIITIKNKIPATSSSMLRYFIGKYLNDIESKENYLKKIKNLIYGTNNINLNEQRALENTINLYKKFFNGNFPSDKNYLKEYNSIMFQSGGTKKKHITSKKTNKKINKSNKKTNKKSNKKVNKTNKKTNKKNNKKK